LIIGATPAAAMITIKERELGHNVRSTISTASLSFLTSIDPSRCPGLGTGQARSVLRSAIDALGHRRLQPRHTQLAAPPWDVRRGLCAA